MVFFTNSLEDFVMFVVVNQFYFTTTKNIPFHTNIPKYFKRRQTRTVYRKFKGNISFKVYGYNTVIDNFISKK